MKSRRGWLFGIVAQFIACAVIYKLLEALQ